jgi:hypothetical protein
MKPRCIKAAASEERSSTGVLDLREQPLITDENLARLTRLFILLASVPLPNSSLEEGDEENKSFHNK